MENCRSKNENRSAFFFGISANPATQERLRLCQTFPAAPVIETFSFCRSHLPESSFTGLGEVEYFSLADNRLLEIPRDVLRKMPKLKTLDLGRSRISSLRNEDFRVRRPFLRRTSFRN